MNRFIVKVEHRHSPTDTRYDYFQIYNYDPYQRGNCKAILTTESQSEAFKFRSRSAAEMIAALIGGRVVKLKRKVPR